MRKCSLLVLPLLLLLPQPVLAENSSSVNVIQEGNSSVSVNVQNEVNTGGQDITISQKSEGSNNSVEVNNNQFKIQGKINSISGNKLDLSGQQIEADSSKLAQLKVGEKIKVEGEIVNGVFKAKIINGITAPPKPSFVPTSFPIPSAPSNSQVSPSAQVNSQIASQISQLINLLNNLIQNLKKLI